MNRTENNPVEQIIFYKKKTSYYVDVTTNTDIDENTGEEITTEVSGDTHVYNEDFDMTQFVSGNTKYEHEDITKNCKLTMEDLDKNFLSLKDYDIHHGFYDSDEKEIILVRNNPNIPDIVIKFTDPEEAPEEGEEKEEPGISGEYDANGNLILKWFNSKGEEQQTIINPYIPEETEEESPKYTDSQTPNIDKAVTNKDSTELIESIPLTPVFGDKYVYIQKVSEMGHLYSGGSIDQIKNKLLSEGLIWHIPSESEWKELFATASTCIIDGYEYSDKVGKALKSQKYWPNAEVYDDIVNFHALPTIYDEENDANSCVFLSSDGKCYTITDGDNITEGITDVNFENYSIRLVANVDDTDINLNGAPVNILGNTYRVVQIGNQYWLDSNLKYDCEGSRNIDLTDYPNSTVTKTYFIQYDGTKWEQKEILLGESVWMKDENNFISEHILTKTNDNEYILVPRFDSGWY